MKRDTRQWSVLLLLVAAAGVLSYFLQETREPVRFVGDSQFASAAMDDVTSPILDHGAPDLAIAVFVDYRCPACRSAHPALQRAIARDGNIRVIFKDWPVLGERSLEAAEVALASHRQGIYPAVHDAFMRSKRLDTETMRSLVETAGGSWSAIEADLARGERAIAEQLRSNNEQALSLGLQGTPGYLIGPLLVEGAMTEREFLAIFRRARARQDSRRGSRD